MPLATDHIRLKGRCPPPTLLSQGYPCLSPGPLGNHQFTKRRGRPGFRLMPFSVSREIRE